MQSAVLFRAVSRPLVHPRFLPGGRSRLSSPIAASRPSLRFAEALCRGVHAEAASPAAQTAKKCAVLDVFAQDRRPVILFDGVCNFCNAGVNLVLSLDRQATFRFAALQSDVGKELLKRCNRAPDDISSMVVVEPEAFYLRSDAALRIGEKLQMPFSFLSALLWPLPKPFRDAGYDWIADNRYQLFGMRDACRLSDDSAAERFLS